MPGTPPSSPRFAIPRPADTDTASFSVQVNPIIDGFDANAAHLGRGEGLLPGDLIVSAATTRTGCLLCDGSAVSRTTQAALFAAIGTAYGTGDGSTTFNLPNFAGRVVIGAGAGAGLTARTRGQTGGEESHVLTSAEVPATSVSGSITGQINGTFVFNASGAGSTNNPGGGTQLQTVTLGFTGNVAGGGGAHNNVQPFGVANVFIKT